MENNFYANNYKQQEMEPTVGGAAMYEFSQQSAPIQAQGAESPRGKQGKKPFRTRLFAAVTGLLILAALWTGIAVGRSNRPDAADGGKTVAAPTVPTQSAAARTIPEGTVPAAAHVMASAENLSNGINWNSSVASFMPKDTREITCEVMKAVNIKFEPWKVYENPTLSAGNYHSVYLRPDGTVAATGSSQQSKYANRGYRCDVSGWTDIIQVSAASHTVGVKSDGSVVAVGVNRYGQCDLDNWWGIASVSAGDNSTLGLRYDGTVVARGDNHLGQCDVSDWRDIVQVAAGAETSYGLRSNGTVRAAGGNRSGQREVDAWFNIRAISAGTYFVAGLKEDGTVVTAGISEEWADKYSAWTDIVAISASSTHMVGLRSDGTVVACGRNDYGALDTYNWSDIVAISAGMHFTLGEKSDGTLVAVGSNAFGQLDIVNYV